MPHERGPAMHPARALIALVGLAVLSCGSGRREPPTCEPSSAFADVSPTWDYVPYDPYRDHADQQPPVSAWRDTLLAWTFTLEGYWTDSSTDAISFEFDGATGLEIEEVHATDELCRYNEVTNRIEFHSHYQLSFARSGYTLTGDAVSDWAGSSFGYRTWFDHGDITGPGCPCTTRDSLVVYSGVDPIEPSGLLGSASLTVVTETSTRTFSPGAMAIEIAPR